MSTSARTHHTEVHPSIVTAGMIASLAEASVTYPLEYVKTAGQLASSKITPREFGPFAVAREAFRREGLRGVYTGGTIMVVGSTAKTGVRFTAFDLFKQSLKDEQGNVSGIRALAAGGLAGLVEAVVVITPMETVKTKLIQSASSPSPRYPSSFAGASAMYAQEGFRGIYAGVVPVLLRQSLSGAVRFGTYGSLKNLALGSSRPDQSLPGGVAFAIGAVAGVATVMSTMPFDVAKTRLQSIDASQRYKGVWSCLRTSVREEGYTVLWRGMSARLLRIGLSGGLTFFVYEEVASLLYPEKKGDGFVVSQS